VDERFQSSEQTAQAARPRIERALWAATLVLLFAGGATRPAFRFFASPRALVDAFFARNRPEILRLIDRQWDETGRKWDESGRKPDTTIDGAPPDPWRHKWRLSYKPIFSARVVYAADGVLYSTGPNGDDVLFPDPRENFTTWIGSSGIWAAPALAFVPPWWILWLRRRRRTRVGETGIVALMAALPAGLAASALALWPWMLERIPAVPLALLPPRTAVLGSVALVALGAAFVLRLSTVGLAPQLEARERRLFLARSLGFCGLPLALAGLVAGVVTWRDHRAKRNEIQKQHDELARATRAFRESKDPNAVLESARSLHAWLLREYGTKEDREEAVRALVVPLRSGDSALIYGALETLDSTTVSEWFDIARATQGCIDLGALVDLLPNGNPGIAKTAELALGARELDQDSLASLIAMGADEDRPPRLRARALLVAYGYVHRVERIDGPMPDDGVESLDYLLRRYFAPADSYRDQFRFAGPEHEPIPPAARAARVDSSLDPLERAERVVEAVVGDPRWKLRFTPRPFDVPRLEIVPREAH
jgi:hypothetical protein